MPANHKQGGRQVATVEESVGELHSNRWPVANFAASQGPVAGNGRVCDSSYGIDAMRQMLIIYK